MYRPVAPRREAHRSHCAATAEVAYNRTAPLPDIPTWSRRRTDPLSPFAFPGRIGTNGFARKGSLSPEPWLLAQPGPIENVRRPWDAWLEEERYLETHTPPRPLMTRYKAHVTPCGDSLAPALEEERRQHPDSTAKAHTIHPKDRLGKAHYENYLMSSSLKKSTGTIQGRHHRQCHQFWLAQPLGPDRSTVPTTHKMPAPFSLSKDVLQTGLRLQMTPRRKEASIKDPRLEPGAIFYRRKAPVERTLGFTETQKVGHYSHTKNASAHYLRPLG